MFPSPSSSSVTSTNGSSQRKRLHSGSQDESKSAQMNVGLVTYAGPQKTGSLPEHAIAVKRSSVNDNMSGKTMRSPDLSTRRHLSMLQLLLLNSVVCGLEFCASAAFTYIPPMLLKAGLDEAHMSIVLGIGPLLGFFLVPVIGRASDQCRSRYGRRRPFIFWLGLLLICSLIVIPYGEVLGTYAIGSSGSSKHLGVVLLIIGAVILDFTSQASLTPCEALLSDASRNTNQKDRCFAIYSFMVSFGGCIGYLIAAVDWNHSSVGIFFGSQEKSTFTILIILFIMTLFATLTVADETPLSIIQEEERMREDAELQRGKKNEAGFIVTPPDPGYETDSDCSTNGVEEQCERGLLSSTPTPALSPRRGVLSFLQTLHIPWTYLSFTSFSGLIHLLGLRIYGILPVTIKALFNVPFCLKRLAFANFCSWSAVMGFNLFYTDFVGQAVYGGNPNAPEDSPASLAYDEGVRAGSWGLLFHCIMAAIYAMFVERLVDRYGMQKIYFFGMLTFTFSMMVMVFVRNVILVTLMASMTGIAYATVTTIPFMLITQYHENKEIYYSDLDPLMVTSARGMATDMATVDSAYFLSQIVLSACMGYIVFLTGTVLSYMVVAGATGAVACGCVARIIYTKQQMATCMRNHRKATVINDH